MLRLRLKVETLPEVFDDDVRKGISEYLMTLAREFPRGPEQLEDISYKVERDGKLMASIASARTAQERMGADRPIVLLSSSYLLRCAEDRFRQNFGAAKVLISIGALSYLLSTVPDAGLGADSLRRALFEFGTGARLSDPGRRALRIIRATESYDIPWAERELLQVKLTAAIRSEAEKRGMPEASLRTRLASGEEPKVGAQLIAETLQEMAIKDKTSEELAETSARSPNSRTKSLCLKNRSSPPKIANSGRYPSCSEGSHGLVNIELLSHARTRRGATVPFTGLY